MPHAEQGRLHPCRRARSDLSGVPQGSPGSRDAPAHDLGRRGRARGARAAPCGSSRRARPRVSAGRPGRRLSSALRARGATRRRPATAAGRWNRDRGHGRSGTATRRAPTWCAAPARAAARRKRTQRRSLDASSGAARDHARVHAADAGDGPPRCGAAHAAAGPLRAQHPVRAARGRPGTGPVDRVHRLGDRSAPGVPPRGRVAVRGLSRGGRRRAGAGAAGRRPGEGACVHHGIPRALGRGDRPANAGPPEATRRVTRSSIPPSPFDSAQSASVWLAHFFRAPAASTRRRLAMAAADKNRTKIVLDERDIPTRWYNIQADLKTPAPPVLHPGTGNPIGPQDLAPLFPMELIKQEVSQERWIPIPDEVRDVLRLWRPSPLYRALRLEQALGTPARIYYKYEGVSPAGSHKPNTAVAQAYYNKQEKVARISTETGAGQWGSALAMACAFFGLQCKVYMVKVSYNQKPYRRIMMETWGAQVVPSPSPDTQAGKKVLQDDADSPGSLGIAISEAVEDAATRDDTKYSLGSVLNHVLMHQTVIGLETKKQLEKADDEADIVIGCAGGGSNFSGLSFPFAADKLTGKKKKLRIIAVEPAACPSLTKGKYLYDFGDTVGLTPLVKMHTLGHGFVPPPLHAGGLRYHGMAPLVCKLYDEGVIEAVAVPQVATFQAALQFARAEGIIPAPESAHAVRVAIDEALRCKRDGKKQAIVFNLSGHGHFDLGAYEQFLGGRLQDFEYPAEKIEAALRAVPKVKA